MSKNLPVKRPSIWARIVKALYRVEEKPERPAHGANWSRPQGQNNPYPARISMSAFASHGYVFAAVSRASQDLAALPVRLIRGKGKTATIIEEHPFLDLMDQPSSYVDGFSLREQLIVDLMLTGGCYLLLAGTNEAPTSLFRLHPEQTKIITDPILGIKGFEFSDSGKIVEYPIDRVVVAQNAAWASGVDSLYGLGGIQPLAKEISADLSAQKLASDAARKGRPDILISPADEADIWDYDQRRAILDAYRGMSNEGGAMVLSGQVKIEPLQVTPRDLEFQAVRTYAREAISAVFGVPPSVLGAGDLNYAVSRQQASNYWEVQTKRGKKLSHLLTQIAKKFDPSLRVEIDYSGVEALQSVRDAQINRIVQHVTIGMPIAEAYAYEGLEDAPVIPESEREDPADDLGDEESQNVRALDALLRSMTKDVDLGKKSNAREAMAALSEATQKGLKKKGKEHNEEYGDNKEKRLTNVNYLAVSYHRGLSAFYNNPASVRPTVQSAGQWAMARVNGLLFALRNGRYKRKPYDTDLLPEAHPLKNSADKKKDQKITNFPQVGDDQVISMRNSKYPTFDPEYAQDLKENWPQIWKRGGNIEGDNQYRRLLPIVTRKDKKAQTETEEMAIKKREAWAARHSENFRIAGVVAQIKWFVIGAKGQSYMKKLINDEKKRLSKHQKEIDLRQWTEWIQMSHGPAERKLERVVSDYLEGAQARYKKRIREYVRSEKSGPDYIAKGVLSWPDLLALGEEVARLTADLGRDWLGVWTISGNRELENVYRRAKKERPLDLVFGERAIAESAIDLSAFEIASTTAKEVQKLIERGLLSGLSVRDIAKSIDKDSRFGRKRAQMIARTEATKAINLATSQSYQTAANEGIKIRKQWLTSGDDKVRDTHRELNRQIVGVNEDFVIPSTGEAAPSPAEFSNPAESINCRCTIIPVID